MRGSRASQQETPANRRGLGSFARARDGELLERVLYRREGRGQLGAETLNDGDDGDGNAGGYQSVLDCSGAGFIGKEAADKGFHVDFLWQVPGGDRSPE